MKNILFLLVLSLLGTSVRAQDESYYFGENEKFDANIPTPSAFFGFPIGSALVRYDKVVEYFKLLADKSDRASYVVFGKSWENREQIKLIISSPDNQANLESLRKEHLRVVDPQSGGIDYAKQKVIVELAYNVHGGEIAGTDAAVLAAYYLVASQNPDILKRLQESIVLVEPSQNPDGRERATNFINGFHSEVTITDAADLGHSGGWTPHRGNHFWNDLNRDWLALSQVESKNRVAYYHQWYPNVYLDFHEMGSGSTYYFEPSPLTTWNKIIPKANYEVLTAILAKHFSGALNSIGSLYYTKESFTNLSPIYGSTYPDYQGGVGTTLEVGSTSGVAIETAAGVRTFARNLKDNLLISIASLRAATDEKETFLRQQREFFETAFTQADRLPYKTIVFGSEKDNNLNRLFLDHLLRHNIQVYSLGKRYEDGKKLYEPGQAYVVPLRQAQFRILQSIFEENETNEFDAKTTFYDVSGYSTAHGYGIQFSKVKVALAAGELIRELPVWQQKAPDQSALAYAFEFTDYLAPKALYELQAKGVVARVSRQAFTSKTSQGEHEFSVGSIVIANAYQQLQPAEVYSALQQVSVAYGIQVHAITDGFSVKGIDLGSNNIAVLKKPQVALVSGGNWTSFGEVWSLLGNTHGIPVVKLNGQTIDRADLNPYTAIILTGGPLSPVFAQRLEAWVEGGGTLIALSAAAPAVTAAFEQPNRRAEGNAETGRGPRAAAEPRNAAAFPARLNGVVVRGELNRAHPLTYGFGEGDLYVLKSSTSGLDSTVVEHAVLKSKKQLVNGFVDSLSLKKLTENVVVGTSSKGRGSIVYFSESPTFRGYWLSTGRLLTNALFFGGGGSARRFSAEEQE